MKLRIVPILFLIPLFASAEEYCTGRSQAALRNEPGGSQRGSLYPAVCAEVLETRGSWMRISVEGWVNASDLVKKSELPASAGGPAPTAQEAALLLERFDIQLGNRDAQGRPTRVVLVLTVKNITARPLAAWSGILVVQQQASDKALFRYKVSDDEANLPPGASKQVSFYWDRGEEPFSLLVDEPKESLKVALHKIETRK